ncbi:MAG: hypothetical protein RLZZ333_268, partial [Bacteroidota bacterium]
ISSLPAGQTQTFDYQAATKKTGEMICKATIAGTNISAQEASVKTMVSEIKLSVSMGGPDRRAIQRPASYQVTVANTGSQTVQRIRVSSKLPQNIELLAASHSGSLQMICSNLLLQKLIFAVDEYHPIPRVLYQKLRLPNQPRVLGW